MFVTHGTCIYCDESPINYVNSSRHSIVVTGKYGLSQ